MRDILTFQSSARSLSKVFAVCLLAAVATAFLLLETALAQDGQGYRYVDLVMSYEQENNGDVTYRVRNTGTATAIGVTVSFLLEDLEARDISGIITEQSGATQRFTWGVGNVPSGETRELTFYTRLRTGYFQFIPTDWPGLIGIIRGEATSLSPEPDILLANNVITVYSLAPDTGVSKHMRGNKLSLLLSVDNLMPEAEGDVNFDLTANNQNITTSPFSRFRNMIADARVRIKLSKGLKFKEGWTPPAEFDMSNNRTATWSPQNTDTTAAVPDLYPRFRGIEIQTQLTSDSFSNIPLGERCVTAWVEDSIPPPSSDYVLGNIKQCLGDDPPLLFEQGTLRSLTAYPCVDASGNVITAYPCNDKNGSDSEIAVIAVAGSDAMNPNPRKQGVGRSDRSEVVLLPENGITVHVKDPQARVVSGGSVTWQTGREEGVGPKTVPGVIVTYSVKDFLDTTSGKECPGTTTCRWSNLARTIKVKGLTQDVPPSGVKIKINDSDEFQHYDANSGNSYTHRRATWPLGQYVSNRSTTYFLEFSELGTYVIDFTAGVTRRSDSAVQEDTGTYIFHVGPIAELEVRDAGPNPAIASSQRVYTITAVNNGPDATSAEILLSPEIAHAIPSEGHYRNGTWHIAELESADIRRGSGKTKGPTLTMVAESDAPIVASIAAVGEYSVCIGSDGNDIETYQSDCEATSGASWHSTNYYDYREDNNRTEIMPWLGTGEGEPGLPRGLTAVETPVGNVLRWEPVERVNGHPVTSYQVQRRGQDWQHVSDVTDALYLDEAVRSATLPYRVRAVNWMGVAGPWSKPSTEDGAGQLQDSPTVTPDPVVGLTAIAGDGYVDLEWRAHPSDGREVIWQLWRDDDPTWWDIGPRAVGSSRLGYTVTGLANDVAYTFRVRAAHPTDDGGLITGPPSSPVLAVPTAPPGPEPPPGPNTPPEFDTATAWPDPPWCVNGGAGAGTVVAWVSAYDQDGDPLQFHRRSGFDQIADNHFSVSTDRSGEVYWGVIRVSRTLPRDLEPVDGFIMIDLEVNDGRGGIDQIGVSLQYDPTGGNCQDTNASSRSGASGESWSSVLATVRTWLGGVRDWWLAWGGWSLTVRPT